MLLESSFHYLFCLTFSLRLVTFSKSYARKQKWMFFLNIDNAIFLEYEEHNFVTDQMV